MSITPLTTLTSAPSNGHQSSLENFSVRRTESIDAPQIMKLIERSTEKCFGKVNVVNIIEKAVLSITLTSDSGEVLGFGAFYDYPGGKFYDPKLWEHEMVPKYGLDGVTPLNSLFLHYFVAKRPYQHDIAQEIIRTVFNACVYVQNIFLLSGTTNLGSALLESFGRVKDGPKEEKLFLCQRHVHVPQLHIREARPEDNDDLAPLFTQQNKVLCETYGDYFLAELIEAQDENHKALVAEVGGLAIGFMCLSTEVDVNLLNNCFELKPYTFLHKVKKKPDTPDDETSIASDSVAEEEVVEVEDEELAREETIDLESSSVERKEPSQTSLKSGAPAEAASSKGEVSVVESNRSVSIPPSHVSEPQSEVSEKPKETEEEPEVEEEPAPEEPVVELGEPTAFCIQLFCIDERYEMRSVDFMTEAFKRFPDKDYCVLTIPHTISEFPLLQVFARCTPKPTSTLEQELYVFHRSALLQNIAVRFGTEKDTEGVSYITRKYKGKSTVLADYNQYLSALRDEDGTPLYGIVMECGDQIIGVAIIRAEMDTEYLRSHYGLEDFIYFTQHSPREHGHLFHCAVSATFTNFTKFFLRECLRLCEMSCMYYNVYDSSTHQDKPQSTVEALHHLVQIRPRRQIKYPVELLRGTPPAVYDNVPIDGVLKTLPPFALFHINRKLTLEPKMVINSRIVVVGASDVSLSFLETLILCPHMHFNNLVLVSPEGLPLTAPAALPSSLSYSPDYMRMISLATSCNIVTAKMTSINRAEQYVEVDNGRKVQYDYLVLCTGSQFQCSLPQVEEKKLSVSSPVSRDVTAVARIQPNLPPPQATTLDSLSKAEGIVNWVSSHSGPAIVYGTSLSAYTTIQALLEGGVKDIVSVQPPTLVSCFNNPQILAIVEEAMTEAGVKIMKDFVLSGYSCEESGDLTGIEVTPTQGPVQTVQCGCLVTLQDKVIDSDTFGGINNSCLVFDGRLVIDTECHTNDPVIYAAGPLTKYKRAFYCDEFTHDIYCSKEIGERLASVILPIFDPSFPPVEEVEKYELPKYVRPKQVYAKLPGGYHYLDVSKPQPLVDLQTAMMDPNYGRELVTGDKDVGYFRLHLNQYHTVETITCLSKKEIELGNICQLYGVHQQYMNSLEERFDGGLISNFFEYFREPWSLILYHDRFAELREEIKELMSQPNQPGEESLSEKVCQLVDEDLAIEEKTKIALFEEYNASLAKQSIENRLFSYLSYNKYHLPHYAGRNMA
ncbi:hypothetical protein ACHWQZ_G001647 [Mnemiopsis leidyi]